MISKRSNCVTLRLSSVGIVLLCLLTIVRSGDDYYEILGVGREADTREIRKAFKKLALTHHPDKSDDPDAQEKFLKINKAYETLKDEEKRKRYDRFGEEDDQDKSNFRYQSWNFYHDDFGIYDDDPEIITLSYNDFRRSVSESYDFWFINFYSPQCSHCHQLAPTWRRVARELEGIVRFGAVNCQDDFHLCSEQGIRAYPTLKMFGPDGGVVYRGDRDDEALTDFAIRQLPRMLHYIWPANLEKYAEDDNKGQDPKLPWVIMFCDDDDVTCPDRQGRDLVASTLQGLANVGTVDCKRDRKFCETFCGDEDLGVFYFKAGDVEAKAGQRINSLEHREISSRVLDLLPDIKDLDDEQYSNILLRLEDDSAKPWLIHFVFGDDGVSVEEKKLRALLPRLKIGRFDCKDNPADCAELMLREPRYVVFKPGGGYEFHYGRSLAPDVAAFARASAQARTLRTLTHRDFPDILDNEPAVFIDFFAPWCPPCMNLLPEYRKAAILTGGSVVYGTVDCTANPTVCNRFGVRSYPTTMFFNVSKPHHYMGRHTGHAIADFVKEILKPSVIQLTHSTFYELLGDKDEDEMWLVDFYAPWCGPCMQLAPQWTELAKMVEKIPEVKVAKVDCTTEQRLCERELVRSYPSIRMYPLGEEGIRTYIAYTGFRRDAHSLRQWVFDRLPSVVENLTPYSFEHHVLRSNKPALIDFYAPWCGHCQQFAPDFEDIALTLRKRGVLCGKIDCERYRKLCAAAGVRAYPTLRFYVGAEGTEEQEYEGLEIKTQVPARIVEIVNKELGHEERRAANSVHDEL